MTVQTTRINTKLTHMTNHHTKSYHFLHRLCCLGLFALASFCLWKGLSVYVIPDQEHSLSANTAASQVSPAKLNHTQPQQWHNSRYIHHASFSTQWINQTDAMSMLDQMDDDELTGYLKNMIPRKQLFKLIDKRIFAKNALMILYHQNTPENNKALQEKTNNIITMGVTPTYTQTHADTRQVDIEQKLYAHLKVPNKQVHGGKVFVTWIHRESGQVMLFNMMYLNPRKTENWVSLKPPSGWLKGSYDVSMYRFSNELEPIAKHTYTIDHVINDGLDADEWDLDELLPEDEPQPETDTDANDDVLFEI